MRTDPYCRNCGYSLMGLTESSKCPECGQPLVDVLTRDSFPNPQGRRYESPIRIFGLPLVSIALGPAGMEKRGHARGIIAIGDIATGWVAIGALSCGVFALGGCAVGVVALGGLGIGLIALGGMAVGLASFGGGAVGVTAMGGGAVGYVAQGGGAIGHYARSAGSGRGILKTAGQNSASRDFFTRCDWLFGATGAQAYRLPMWAAITAIALAACVSTILIVGFWLRDKTREPPATRAESG